MASVSGGADFLTFAVIRKKHVGGLGPQARAIEAGGTILIAGVESLK
ncbi:hypothetical protein [Salinibacterium sp. TMP30]